MNDCDCDNLFIEMILIRVIEKKNVSNATKAYIQVLINEKEL